MKMFVHLKTLLAGILLSLLIACSSEEPISGTISLQSPKFITQSRAVDKDGLTPTLLVDDELQQMTKKNGEWTGVITVTANQLHSISISWTENYRNRNLELGSATKQIVVGSSNINVSFLESDFDTKSHDDDDDGTSNIEERESDTNPFLSTSVENSAVLTIPKLPVNATKPNIDGSYSSIEWQYATGEDRYGAILYIDNLLQTEDSGTDESDGEPIHRWLATHDDTYLYMLILFDDIHNTSDSETPWDDDNLNIYIDGDYSHGSSYDGINDRHMHIPLLKSNGTANSSGSSDSRIRTGINSAEIPQGKIWANGINTGPSANLDLKMDVYEVRLNISQFNIQVGQLFGIDVHLDDDDSGNDRDSKWGWFLPSDQGLNVDLTYEDPSKMAAAALEK